MACVGLAALVSLLMRGYIAPTNIAMVYLLAVVAVSALCSRRVSVAASFVSVAAFDFLCVPPYLTFAVTDYEYVAMFAGMLAVSLVISTQTAKLKDFAQHAAEREARTEALYRLSRALAGETRVFEAARAAAAFTQEALRTRVVIFLPREGRIRFDRRTSEDLPLASAEEPLAQGVLDSGEWSGARGKAWAAQGADYLPLRGTGKPLAVMALLRDRGQAPSRETLRLAEGFATQTALAMEQIASQSAAEEARLKTRTEEMRSSLLSAVSHDLRTPLAAITGSASTLRTQWDRLTPEIREGLLESISDEAERLGRLVSNLIDVTRFASGALVLRRESFPLEEIVGSTLQRLEPQLTGRSVQVEIPENLPMVCGDDVLLAQVLWNLVENAAKYTPQNAPIEIAAMRRENAIVLEVRDRGPGIQPGEEERIFEKFYRGERMHPGAAVSSRGAGLGLPICRAIIEAHGGKIQVFAREQGGAVFQIRLPIEAKEA
ncbi:MAG: ATP-binding protein [Acidobacteriota bacterium]